jgi:succinyl-diaminopimelate desuccinylase
MENCAPPNTCDLAQDPVALTQALVRCPSVTPIDAGALDLLAQVLEHLGLEVHRLTFDGDAGPVTPNLYARWGTTSPHFCFAGHTDVVPAGHEKAWRYPPFEGRIDQGYLWGRGAVDMKGAIGAFVSALAGFLKNPPEKGSISLMITGDEEATGINGTPKILKWLEARGETIDFCLVGEPTSCVHLGDTLKIGRRGSLNSILTTHGTQGHVAFPQKADNPVPRLMATLLSLGHGPCENASLLFEPTRLEITSIDVGNPTVNLIPGQATARFNIRFSDQQTPASLVRWLEETCARLAGSHTLETTLSGVAEAMNPGPLTDMMVHAAQASVGQTPVLSTKGATSDARFIRHVAPVLEFGLKNHTMHQVDECVALDDLHQLARLYAQILQDYFNIL